MGRTFKYLPINVPKIFEELVGKVDTNLTSDASLNITSVSFKHGNWNDIKAELIKQGNSNSEDDKNRRYPLVCLVHSYDENYVGNIDEITVDIVILATCGLDEHIPYKYSELGNYPTILNPIWAELVSVIKRSRYFDGYLQKLPFPKRDLIHFTDVADANSYTLPDYLDGIAMPNLKLKLNKPACTIGSQCVPIYEVDYISAFTFVEMQPSDTVGTLSFRFRINQAIDGVTYSAICNDTFEAYDDMTPDVDYLFDMSSLLSLGIDLVTSIELSGSDGSSANMPIQISETGEIVAHSLVITNEFSINTQCGNYLPLYAKSAGEVLSGGITQGNYTVDGIKIYAKPFSGTISEAVEIKSDDFPSVYVFDITAGLEFGLVTVFVNTMEAYMGSLTKIKLKTI